MNDMSMRQPKSEIPPSASPVLSPTLSLAGDHRGAKILAKTIYRELRSAGLSERDVLAIATELLSETAADLKSSAR